MRAAVFHNMLSGTKTTPTRLAAFTALGSIVSVAGFASVRSTRDSLPALVASAALAFGGIAVVYLAPSQLRDGISNERWTADELNPLRRVVEHPAWTTLTVLLVVAMFASIIVARSHRPYFWAAFLLLQPMSQLSSALRKPPKPAGTPARLDWSKVPPLQSDHWGER